MEGPPGRRQAGSRKIALAHEPTSLDRLIRDGPPDGDLNVGLESTRLRILDQGIKSDSDGMVCFLIHNEQRLLLIGLSPLLGFTFG
jgi:cell cycle arrest protein BUB2